MSQVIVESQPVWPILLATLVAGFGGVLAGVAVTIVFELWRRGLDAQAAARIIRTETIANRSKADALIRGERPVGFDDAAWVQYGLQIAPYLDELDLIWLAKSYDQLKVFPHLKLSLSGLAQSDRAYVERWLEEAREHGRKLRALERQSTFLLATEVLRKKRVASLEELEASVARYEGMPGGVQAATQPEGAGGIAP